MRSSRRRRRETWVRFDSWSSVTSDAPSPWPSRLVRDDNDAREVVQEAFLRAFQACTTFQGSSSFFTWLYRIITNLSIDLMRKPGRQTADFDETRTRREKTGAEADLPDARPLRRRGPGRHGASNEIAARLQSALDALPSYHRAVVVMREVEGLSYEDMARGDGGLERHNHEPALPRPSEAPARAGRLLRGARGVSRGVAERGDEGAKP